MIAGSGDTTATVPPLDQAALVLHDLAGIGVDLANLTGAYSPLAGLAQELVDLLTNDPDEQEHLRRAIRRGIAHGRVTEGEWIAAGMMEPDDEDD